jgi:hypothetical protein
LAVSAASCTTKPRAVVTGDYCAEADAYEFRNISDFGSGASGWFLYADNTPGGVPDTTMGSNVQITQVDAPGRCGDTGMVELKAYGHNFYGTGYGDYAHNPSSSRADGTGYDGISFWAKSPGNTDKTFQFTVDDGRTIKLPDSVDGGLPAVNPGDQDLDHDGFIGPGDIFSGTECRVPPSTKLASPACYAGGAQPPGTTSRVPEPDECGNQFHTWVTVTDEWHLYRIPWDQLVQWPCPNRLEGGIDHADIAEMEILFIQGSVFDLWLDNIAFYRSRQDGGSTD